MDEPKIDWVGDSYLKRGQPTVCAECVRLRASLDVKEREYAMLLGANDALLKEAKQARSELSESKKNEEHFREGALTVAEKLDVIDHLKAELSATKTTLNDWEEEDNEQMCECGHKKGFHNVENGPVEDACGECYTCASFKPFRVGELEAELASERARRDEFRKDILVHRGTLLEAGSVIKILDEVFGRAGEKE